MDKTSEQRARDELRARQGSGARYDAPDAPASALILARRGTAYFSRKLNELRDHELDDASLIDGWSRRHVIAHISYHARAIARLAEGIGAENPEPMYASVNARDAEIALGATLPTRALRTLFQHTEVHLNVVWRDLPNPAWASWVMLMDGQIVTLPEAVAMRAREIWTCGVYLGNGGSMRDIPAEIQAMMAHK